MHLNGQMKLHGGQEYLDKGSPQVRGQDLQRAAAVPDVPNSQKWEATQKTARVILSPKPIVTDPNVLPFLKMAGITDVTFISIICVGLEAVGVAQAPQIRTFERNEKPPLEPGK